MNEKLESAGSVIENMAFTLKRLAAYKAKGYLFHGGKDQVALLTPQQASDRDESRVVGRQKAVYASDSLHIAIVMALLDKKDPTIQGWSSGYSGNETQLQVTGENFTLTPGFVHVLPRNSFIEIEDEKKGDREIVSYEPVTPKDIIRVTPPILSYLPEISVADH